MKKYLTLLCFLVIGLSSCQKVYTSKLKVTQAEIDDQKIQDYIAANNITGAVKDPTGIYYKILLPGTTPNPKSNSIVKVTYTLTFLNGVSIGNVDGQTAQLTSFIRGVQIALPKIGTGGRMLLFVPSGLAYGAVGSSNIPENSVLNYTLDLNGIAN
ncbi:MAG: FKBP-type peptidyl-prolyl cis-trans isomerase [Bacteroidota bacterium]